VSNPTDSASPFGWHDIDGIAGPEFTTTRVIMYGLEDFISKIPYGFSQAEHHYF
jgi:hypothetical protein